jgi:glycosyltransferase involved in cell wall biosynthesis
MGTKIAYIMSRFPHLPETFILREMNEMGQFGWDIALYPLIRQEQSVIHDEARPWLDKAQPLPFFSAGVLAANLRTLFKKPGRYLSLWGQAIAQNLSSPNLLIRAIALLPKAVYAAELMQAEGIQHIHAHYATHPALVAWAIKQLTGISYSVTVHAHDIFVRTAMLDTKMREATFVAAISNFNRDYLGDKVGQWVKDKIFIVHCGIQPEKYTAKPRQWQAGERFELITIGSLQPYKGQKVLVEACALLRDKGVPFRCQVIGSGEEKENLEQQIAQHHLQNEVLLLGGKKQSEVAELLATAHCYLQPSIITPSGKMEGIPVALMEAMAGELPVLASALSGIPELVRPGETGYLVPPAEAQALADMIEKIYHEPAEAARLAANGRALVLQEFELRANVEQLAKLFNRFVQR